MEVRKTRNLAIILVLLAVVIYTLIPNNPGIHIGSFDRSLKTQLGLDLRGGMRVLLEADLPADKEVTPQQLNDAKQILESRSNALGVSEVVFSTAGSRRLVGEFPGLTNTDQVIQVLKQTGQLAFVPMGKTPVAAGTELKVDYANLADPTAQGASIETPTPGASATPQATPDATQAAGTAATQSPDQTATQAAAGQAAADNNTYMPLMTGDNLQNVSVTRDKLGKYAVSFELKTDATQRFADYTSSHIGDYLAIVLDNKVIEAPVIESAITQGSGQISGNFDANSANALAVNLRYGSLPVPFKVAESRAVGATLGQESINKSIQAGVIGLLMVMLFMAVYYRLPGIIADVALLIYAATSLALFKLIPVTLTLPGIAGFVLSIGVAVDANVLIFSRLKEELRAGRSLRQAIDLGWQRAWPSIRDSNISTLITCGILFWFGSSFGASLVKGFALTLALGVGVSLFTAIFVTRTILHLVLDNLAFTEHPRWFYAESLEQRSADRVRTLDIIGKRYIYFAISLAVIIPGMIALALWGLPLSIDYTGGSMLEINFAGGQTPTTEQVINVYNQYNVPVPQVQTSGQDVLIVRSKQIDEATKTNIVNELQSRFGTVNVVRFDTVGPSVGQEVTTRAAGAVALAALGILLYITFAFRGIQHAFRYGVAAILAMMHDVLVVIGMGAILGHFLHWEIDSLFLTALLTVIGFSVHDTIVVFDRIRENSNLYRKLPFLTVVNHSIVQTLDRSINTQFTVMLTLLALALFGGETTQHFVVTLLIGVFSGTYSSIFNAAPILVVWENREWRYWFHRPSREAEREEQKV